MKGNSILSLHIAFHLNYDYTITIIIGYIFLKIKLNILLFSFLFNTITPFIQLLLQKYFSLSSIVVVLPKPKTLSILSASFNENAQFAISLVILITLSIVNLLNFDANFLGVIIYYLIHMFPTIKDISYQFDTITILKIFFCVFNSVLIQVGRVKNTLTLVH